MNTPRILFAPLQGFTDYFHRNAHQNVIGGVDEYFAPYLRLDNDKALPKKQLRDILPENNRSVVVPQVLVNNADDFIYLANLLADYGYDEVNLNLGCPYPMVVNRNLGSGLLNKPDGIKELLENSLPKIKMKVSVKLRLGLDQDTEIQNVLPVLNQFELSRVIIHPRIARKLYKGEANVQAFVDCKPDCRHKMVYNGDITTVEKFNQIKKIIPDNSEIMIGRGLLWDVFLAAKIKDNHQLDSKQELAVLNDFHNYIFESINELTSGFSHAHNKLLQFWSYFAYHFSDSRKIVKQIKKCKSEAAYFKIVDSVFDH